MPAGRTDAGRRMSAFATTESLSIEKIWNLWLPKYLSKEIYKTLDDSRFAKFRLKLLLTIIAPIPRAVQFAVIELQRIVDVSETARSKILSTFIEIL